ncbi:sirohydrochlorin chelatase [Jiangella sp. DSM 45060]|uniref:sirohydrochlorin chelatase n=1 Tax=Jiangella sp. DSM 45060 TaxID=1798224 RepID=UPI00087C5FD9|nr:CbiX/SirB N-terminal domain-containing protein [Jiangella sp. DSM 45060]SDT71603.1 Sirohydrochlorin ferrochelatase [Jiangella sp. DSM 45060]
MTLIAVAHGTRAPEGPVVLESLLSGVRTLLPGVDVRVAYVDVIEPTLSSVLAGVPAGERPVVVPMFLASGYHVRVDVPEAVTADGGRALVTPALGPDAAVVAAVEARLRSASADLPSAVVLAAAGSSDASALAEVSVAASLLSSALSRPVVPAFVTTASPSVPDAVASLRAAGHARVGVASYLLAPGLFQQRLTTSGADVVAPPIGPHPLVAALIAERYRAVTPPADPPP